MWLAGSDLRSNEEASPEEAACLKPTGTSSPAHDSRLPFGLQTDMPSHKHISPADDEALQTVGISLLSPPSLQAAADGSRRQQAVDAARSNLHSSINQHGLSVQPCPDGASGMQSRAVPTSSMEAPAVSNSQQCHLRVSAGMAALQVSSPACSSFAASPVPALTRAEQALEAALGDGTSAELSAAIHAAVKVLGSADASESKVPQVGIGPAYLGTQISPNLQRKMSEVLPTTGAQLLAPGTLTRLSKVCFEVAVASPRFCNMSHS